MSIGTWLKRLRNDTRNVDTFDSVTLDAAHRVLAPAVDAALGGRRFEAVAPLTWVRSDGAPIRPMFAFPAWKGGVIAPRWGFSFDFVPHVSGNAVRWHRTGKSAIFDFAVDARDRALDISVIHGERGVADRAAVVVKTAIARADELWQRVESIEDVVAAFEWLRAHLSSGGLGFYNYVQHPIALAFVLAKTGDAAGARRELDRFLEGRSPDDTVSTRLRELLSKTADGG
ncbi:hypothetical protein Q3A80_14240 [Burkholderia sp. SR8]|jgi:hypothetical protein|uniref:hypothetical protein n=1 Tax=Burkholderia sp. SR8 TaxID=3062277 RepID=UPI004063B415